MDVFYAVLLCFQFCFHFNFRVDLTIHSTYQQRLRPIRLTYMIATSTNKLCLFTFKFNYRVHKLSKITVKFFMSAYRCLLLHTGALYLTSQESEILITCKIISDYTIATFLMTFFFTIIGIVVSCFLICAKGMSGRRLLKFNLQIGSLIFRHW